MLGQFVARCAIGRQPNEREAVCRPNVVEAQRREATMQLVNHAAEPEREKRDEFIPAVRAIGHTTSLAKIVKHLDNKPMGLYHAEVVNMIDYLLLMSGGRQHEQEEPYVTLTTTGQTNADIVRAFIASFWNGRDFDSLNRFLTPDYIDHAYLPHTANGLKETAGVLSIALPDHRSTIEDVVAQGEKVVARMTLRGTHDGPFRGTPPTGNPVEVEVYRMYRLAEGRVAEHWALLDTATLLRQIAAQPSPENACKR